MIERYYVKVRGTLGCQVAHDTLPDAFAEAKRLHEILEGKKLVYVMQVIGVIEGSDPPPLSKSARHKRNLRARASAVNHG